MKIVTKHAKTGLLTSVILLSIGSANANNAEDRYIYILEQNWGFLSP